MTEMNTLVSRAKSFFAPSERRRSLVISLMVSAWALGTLAGCFKPQTRAPEPSSTDEVSTSTFIVDEVRGRADQGQVHQGFSIPRTRFYAMSVCVRDKRTQEPIRGQRFEINGATEGEAKNVTSDANGCVNWSEDVQFDFLAGERYVPVERLITAKSRHSGTRRLRLALNPWRLSANAADLVDLSRATVPEGTLASSEEAISLLGPSRSAGGARLHVRSLQIEATPLAGAAAQGETSPGRMLRLDLGPALLVKNLQGSLVEVPLADASLEVQAVLSLNGTEGGVASEHRLSDLSQPIRVYRDGEKFRADLPIRLLFGSAQTRYKIGLRVIPKDGPMGLGDFEGLYELGTRDGIMDASSLTPVLENSSTARGDQVFSLEPWIARIPALPNVDLQASLPIPAAPTRGAGGLSAGGSSGPSIGVARPEGSSGTAAGTATGGTSAGRGSVSGAQPSQVRPGSTAGASGARPNLPSGVTRASLFLVRSINAAFSGSQNDTTTSRTVLYQTTLCLTDTSTGGRAPVDVNFTLTRADGRKEILRTKNDTGLEGCLQWEDRISHQFYHTERFYLVPFKITHEASRWEETLQLALNPWERFLFYVDPKQRPELIATVNSRTNAPPSRLVVSGFEFASINERRYKVDPYLNLKMIKPVRIRIPLAALRQSNIVAGRQVAPEGLRDGVWLFNAVLYLQARDSSGEMAEVISPLRGGPHLVRVRGSELRFDGAEFEIADDRLLRARAVLVFEVRPVDETKLGEIRSAQLPRPWDPVRERELLDTNSGLVTPTYSGPTWIREEAGGTLVIPNDDLQTALSSATGEVTGREAREALSPLAGMTVDRLVAKARENERKYRDRMNAERDLARFLRNVHSDYVALTNEATMLQREPGLSTHNVALPKTNAVEKLLESMSAPLPRAAGQGALGRARARRNQSPEESAPTVESLTAFVKGSAPMTPALAARFCRLLLVDMPQAAAPSQQFLADQQDPMAWVEDCMARMSSRGWQDVLTVDRKLRVYEIGQQEALRSRQMGVTVGSDWSFGRSLSDSTSWSAGVSPLGLLAMPFSAALSAVPGFNVISAIAGGMGASVGVSRSHTTGQSVSEGYMFASGVNLNLRSLDMNLELKSTESCALVRVHRDFLARTRARLGRLAPGISAEQGLLMVSRGVMICTGHGNAEPVRFRESYHSFAHGSFDEVLADRGSLLNQPWLITLRGTRDYALLLGFMSARKTAPSQVQEEINVMGLPIERIDEAFKLYGLMTHSAPAMVTLDPREAAARSGSQPSR